MSNLHYNVDRISCEIHAESRWAGINSMRESFACDDGILIRKCLGDYHKFWLQVIILAVMITNMSLSNMFMIHEIHC